MSITISQSLSTPLVVDTQFAALSTNFWIESLGEQPLDQFFDETLSGNARWAPNRVTSGSLLRLKPRLSIKDPDGVLPTEASSFKSVKWYEYVEENGTVTNNGDVTQITDSVVIGSTTVRVYTVASGTGILTVRRNVATTKSYKLKCEAVFTDTRSGLDTTYTSTVTLTAQKTNTPAYVIRPDTERNQTYRPLMNSVSNGAVVVNNITVGATLYYGDSELSTAKYFWYWMDANHTSGVLFGNTTTRCAAYVSGQGTKVLTLNPDKMSKLTIVLKVGSATTDTAPTLSVKETFTVHTLYDEVSCETYSKNGRSLLTSHKEMTFEALMKVNKKNMPDAIRNEYIRLNWFCKKASARAATDKGWGDSVTIPRSELVTTTGDNTLVFPQINILSNYDYLYENEGDTVPIQDDSGSSTASQDSGFVIGRV